MKRNKTNFLSILCLTAIMLCSAVAFGQTNPTSSNTNSSITLKTMRALFPNTPVAIANEIHGGLHVVATVDQLHGYEDNNSGNSNGDLALDNSVLQIGMLVYVEEINMYYRYKGPHTPSGTEFKNSASEATDGGGSYTQTTIVDTNYWESMSEILQTPEKITIVNDCTNGYTWTGNSLKPDGTGTGSGTDYGAGNYFGDHLILMPAADDDGFDSSIPIATYVWDDNNSPNDDTDDKWVLVSKGTQVISASNANDGATGSTGPTNWTIDGSGNLMEGTTNISNRFSIGDMVQLYNDDNQIVTYIKSPNGFIEVKVDDSDLVIEKDILYADIDENPSFSHTITDWSAIADPLAEGDLVKLTVVDSNNDPTGSYVTWAVDEVTYTSGANSGYSYTWIKIAEFTSDIDKGLFKVFYDITSSFDGTDREVGAITAFDDGSNDITALDMNDFRAKLKAITDGDKLTEIDGATGEVIILYYPVEWDNPLISIEFNNEKYELTNGILIETIEASTTSGDFQTYNSSLPATEKVTGFYKRLTVRCGDEGTIYID